MSDAGRSGDVTLADVADGSRIGFVHSAETTSGVNGPGLRYTVFLSGCPLRCLYCHNPDTQTMRLGERTTARRVIEETGRYRAFIARGGGLTVTGGEPLLQPAFVEDLFVGVKQAYGLHTALDTSANGGHRASDRLLANTDLVLLDIKAGNAALYEKVSGGGSLRDVLDFAARLVEHRVAGVDPLRAGPRPDRRAASRSPRSPTWPPTSATSSNGSRCCPTTGSGSTSTPPSDARTRCWARPHRAGSRSTRRWRSSASAACTPWRDPPLRDDPSGPPVTPTGPGTGRLPGVIHAGCGPSSLPTCMDHRGSGGRPLARSGGRWRIDGIVVAVARGRSGCS